MSVSDSIFSFIALLEEQLTPSVQSNTSIWKLDHSNNLSPSLRVYQLLPFSSCVLFAQWQINPWPWELLKTFSRLSLPFHWQISKTFWAISSTSVLYTICDPSKLWFSPTASHFSTLLGMACSSDLCLSNFQGLPNMSPPLWNLTISYFFWTPKELSLHLNFDSLIVQPLVDYNSIL